MAKGPKVPEKVRQDIRRIYIEAVEKGTSSTAPEVHEALRARYKKDECLHLWPSLRMVQLVLTEYRRQHPGPEDVDAPWSMAASADPQWKIPPEANADLLKIWKWCVVVGRKFTIREAQWVTRLRGAVPFSHQLLIASEYAIRERVSERMVTTDLDAFVVFSNSERMDWLFKTVKDLGAFPKFDPLPYAEAQAEEEAPWELFKGRLNFVEIDLASFAVFTAVGLDWKLAPLASKWTQEADWVYALCLLRLSKGRQWHSFTEKTKNRIAQRLYDIVQKTEDELKSLGPQALYNPSDNGPLKPFRESLTEILKEVGYED